jgi:hypothetical protein
MLLFAGLDGRCQTWNESVVGDIPASISFIVEHHVSAATPDVRADRGECHGWWDELLTLISTRHLLLTEMREEEHTLS